MANSTTSQNTTGKGRYVLAALLVLGAIGFLYAQYERYQPVREERRGPPQGQQAGAPRAAGQRPAGQRGRRDGPPSAEERKAMRERMEASLNLTPDQKAQLDALDKKFESTPGTGRQGWDERRKAFEAILTPEQQQKAREEMGKHMKDRMAQRLKGLPDDQKEKFMQKLDDRLKNGGGPWGPGGRGRRGGGNADGGGNGHGEPGGAPPDGPGGPPPPPE